MAKLGLAIATAATLAAAPLAAAPPATAEEALARQQQSLRSSLGLGCDRGAGEIVVCGRQGPDPNRLPLPIPPEPGARLPGQPAEASEALALSAEKCTTVGPNQQCGGGLPILGIALLAIHIAVTAIREEE